MRTRTLIQAGLVATGVAGLGGCAASAPGAGEAGDHQWHAVAPAAARLALAKDSGMVALSARHRHTAAGEDVEVVTLANDTDVAGENRIVVAVDPQGPTARGKDRPPRVGDYRFTPGFATIRAREWLDGAEVDDTPRQFQNRFGAFSAVTARYPGRAECVYAWQVLRGDAVGMEPASGRISIQYRACDSQRSAQRLLDAFTAATWVQPAAPPSAPGVLDNRKTITWTRLR